MMTLDQMRTRQRQVKRPPRGFTLLEIIITLSIVTLFVSTAASFLVKSEPAEVSEFIPKLHDFVRETRYLAHTEDESLVLTFSNKTITRSPAETATSGTNGHSSIVIPEGLSVYLKKGGSWKKAGSKLGGPTNWLFSRSGCCEPIELKLVSKNSENYYQFDFLTGHPIDEDE